MTSDDAYRVPCPLCLVEAGEQCRYMTPTWNGATVTASPHRERVQAALRTAIQAGRGGPGWARPRLDRPGDARRQLAALTVREAEQLTEQAEQRREEEAYREFLSIQEESYPEDEPYPDAETE